MGQTIYIFISFHIVNITRRVPFFSPKVSMITNVILFIELLYKINKLILRDLCFRHHPPVSQTRLKLIPRLKCKSELFQLKETCTD